MLEENKNSGVSIFECEPIIFSQFIDKMKNRYFLLFINLFAGELQNFEKYITNEFQFLLIYAIRWTKKSRVFDRNFLLSTAWNSSMCSIRLVDEIIYQIHGISK